MHFMVTPSLTQRMVLVAIAFIFYKVFLIVLIRSPSDYGVRI